MLFVYVVLAARELTHLVVGLPCYPGPGVGEGFRIELPVVNQGFDVNMLSIGPGPSFHNVQGITHWIGVLVDPDLLILKSYGVYDQRIPLPTAYFLAEKSRVRVFGMLPLRIDGNQTITAVPVQKGHFPGPLQNLE